MQDFKQTLAELRRSAVTGRVNKDAANEATRQIVKAQRQASRERMTDYSHGGGVPFSTARSLAQVHKRVPRTDLEYEFQKASDMFVLGHALYKAAGRGGLRRTSPMYQELQRLGTELRKAMDTQTATEGPEWIPTELSRSLIEHVRLELRVAALHSRIPMPTPTFELPLEGADVDAYLASEALTDNTSTEAEKIGARTPTTKKITMAAVKLAVRTVWSSELDQDSIVAMGDFIRRKLAQSLANAQEDATINGDTTGPHQDSDTTAADDRRKAWKGYRKISLEQGLATEDGGNLAIALAPMRELRKSMGKFGVNPNGLAWVIPISAHADLLSIPEIETLDTYGPQATILTGEVARIDGIPVLVSEFQREDLNATGVHDGVTTDRSSAQLVWRDGFAYGDRQTVETKSQEVIETDQLVVVTKQRLDFKPIQDETVDPIVGNLFNLAT